MKKCVIWLLAVLMTFSCALAQAPADGQGLELTVNGVRMLEAWEGERDDSYAFLAVDVTLTNWHAETVSLAENVSAALIFRDSYTYEAVPVFERDAIDPLYRMDGTLLIRVPRLVYEGVQNGEGALIVTVEGRQILFTQEDPAEETAAGVTRTLFEQGMALIREHAAEQYIQNLMAVYRDQGLVEMTRQINQGRAAISALKPADGAQAAENDALFVDALLRIDENIGDVVVIYLFTSENGDVDARINFDVSLQGITDAIGQLETAADAEAIRAVADLPAATIPMPTPTPEPTIAPEYRTLAKGDKGTEVLEMQNRLYELGFFEDDYGFDGDFGNVTQTAVKLFQVAAGLPVTGIADSETQALLYSDAAPHA